MDARLQQALSGRYIIERELGAGGMATVWLARDLKHDRPVAVKVLHPQLAALLGAERFLTEIRTTAHLQHPHILPLFDSGDADGLLFYVMPYLDGETLRQRLTREPQLPVADAVCIASEIAGALDYAHHEGVIHRDIKPENILLHHGRALVADFGIALAPSAGDSRLTETGFSLGTPPYMSPEQALCERTLDARSDIYAVGVVLYEMLTGATPFTGASAQAIVGKILTAAPVPPSTVRKEIPAYVEDAVLTALAKEPADRFPTAAALRTALEQTGSTRLRSRATRSNARRGRAIAAIASVLVAAGGAYLATRSGTRSRTGIVAPIALSIAAVPFQTHDTADAYLGDQIPEEILDALTRIPGLTVRPLASALRFRKNRSLDSIAGELKVATVLTGTIAHDGNAMRVTARLYDVSRNIYLPVVSFTNNAANKFALEDSISARIVSAFQLTQTPTQLTSVRARRTSNPAAHDTLMLARWYAEQRTPPALANALSLYRTAIRLDSNYAEAWAGLANALCLRAVFGDSAPLPYFAEAKRNVLHALQLDSNSAAALTTYGFVKVFYDRDYAGAAPVFVKALRIDSTQSATWLWQARRYQGVNRLDSAILSMRRAHQVDPGALIAGTRLAGLLEFADSMGAAEREYRAVLKLDPEYRFARTGLAELYAKNDQCGKALATLPVTPWFFGAAEDLFRPYVWARCGQRGKAKQYLDSLEARALTGTYVSAYYAAVVYSALQDRPSVYRWLSKAIDNNEWVLFNLRAEPGFKPYRADPEFQALVRKAFRS